MNMQTCGEDMDLVNGLFSINGNCGYVLKPKTLLDGVDPRISVDRKPMLMRVAVICGQYLPKSEPGVSDIVDPYVSVETYGIMVDESKSRTRAVRNNGKYFAEMLKLSEFLGFNPVWNEQFEFRLYCPEVAILRFVVKDFDSTSSNDFIGELSIPVESVRAGRFLCKI
jgi:phosphatidylinositol phospholipase C delta